MPERPPQPPYRVPYVAIGDSLTHGMQSIGVSWTSQRCSYPRLIAEYLSATPFTQPTMKGWDPAYPPGGIAGATDDDAIWFGNPPNIELMLREAERQLRHATGAQGGQATLPGPRLRHDPVVIEEMRRWVAHAHEVGLIAFEALRSTAEALVPSTFEEFLCEPPATIHGEHEDFLAYQNLGVFGYKIDDITNTSFDPAQLAPGGPRDAATRAGMRRLLSIAELAFGQLSAVWSTLFRTRPYLFLQLLHGALMLGDGALGAHLDQEKLAYVLRERGLTAFEALRRQQPRIVTLLIGATNITEAAGHGLFDQTTGDQLFPSPTVYKARLMPLVSDITALDSRPYVFLATIPGLTAGPHWTRGRLGTWTTMLPIDAPLTDEEMLCVEDTVAGYNREIRALVDRHRRDAQAVGEPQRLWLVDIDMMQERMVRATRRDMAAARYVIGHMVSNGQIDRAQAHIALRAMRSGDRTILNHLRDAEHALLRHATTLPSAQGQATTAGAAENGEHPEHSAGQELARLLVSQTAAEMDGTADDVDAFVLRLGSGRRYRLTGEYLAADDHGIVQGGAISLDNLHLTNTGYAYMAREFLRVIYEAHRTSGNALLTGAGFPRVPDGVSGFDDTIRRIAREDTLLNSVPRLSATLANLVDMIGAGRRSHDRTTSAFVPVRP